MSFWSPQKPKKTASPPVDTGQAVPVRKKIHRSPPIAFEAKIPTLPIPPKNFNTWSEGEPVCWEPPSGWIIW